MELSLRLKTIASYVKGFNSLADIACDHGYLGIYCALNYGLTEVLLTDINVMPLESAKANILRYNVADKVTVGLGDGLKPLEKVYDVITISGIGGKLMVDILQADLAKAKKAQRLILSANNDVYTLRTFLANNGFAICEEEMVLDYKYYEIIVAKPIDDKINYSQLELKYGPKLLRERNENFCAYYHQLLAVLNEQLAKVKQATGKHNLLARIEEIRSILE